jgi:hypothetical protein
MTARQRRERKADEQVGAAFTEAMQEELDSLLYFAKKRLSDALLDLIRYHGITPATAHCILAEHVNALYGFDTSDTIRKECKALDAQCKR